MKGNKPNPADFKRKKRRRQSIRLPVDAVRRKSVNVLNVTKQAMKKGSRGMTQLLASLDFVVTRQTALNNMMKKYLLPDYTRRQIIKSFSDHCMNNLSLSSRCPMHKRQKSINNTEENNPPNFGSIQLRSKMENVKPMFSKSKSSPKALETQQEQKDLLSHIISQRDISLDAFTDFTDDMKSESIKKNIIPQRLIKRRECNKMMGDSMHHFLILYFQAIFQDSKSIDNGFDTGFNSGSDPKDTIVVERYLKYLIILHKDYLTGKYPRQHRIDHYDRLYPVEEKHDDEEASHLNAKNEISMDEYRIFVEYMCQSFENNVMRKHPGFRETDLILVQSMRYHLVKLSLMLAGEIPSTFLVKSTKNSVLQKFMTLSKKSIHKLKGSRKSNHSTEELISQWTLSMDSK